MSKTAWVVLGVVALLAMNRKPAMTVTSSDPFTASNPDPVGTSGTGNTNALTSLMGAVQSFLQPVLRGPGNQPMLSAAQTPASLPGTISGAAGGTPTAAPGAFQMDPWFYNPMYDSPDGYFDIQSGTLIPHNY